MKDNNNVADCLEGLMVINAGIRDLQERIRSLSNNNQVLKDMINSNQLNSKMTELHRLVNEIYWGFDEKMGY